MFPLQGAAKRVNRLSISLVGLVSAKIAGCPAEPVKRLRGTANPISPGLGLTYGEEWCAPVGSENVPQVLRWR